MTAYDYEARDTIRADPLALRERQISYNPALAIGR